MSVLESILLGDNPITFTLSFLINVCLIWYLWVVIKPMMEENKRLKERLEEKDKTISETSESNNVILTDVLQKIIIIADKLDEGSEVVESNRAELQKVLKALADLQSRAKDEHGDFKDELKDLDKLLAQVFHAVESINTKQTITQSLLFSQQGIQNDSAVTRVK